MRSARLRGLIWILVAAMAPAIAASASELVPVQIAVVAPSDPDHLAWAGARRLQEMAESDGLTVTVEPAALTESDETRPDLLVMPIRSLAHRVSALEVLELPFFYPSLDAVHAGLDGDLGRYLVEQARQRSWEILAFWDEGLHLLSGLKRYDRVRNLKAREFLITRPDPVSERQYRYWKADVRRIDADDREAVLRECLIASRAATPQEIVREQLYRVHLAMSMTRHRYEGWVVVAALDRWAALPERKRSALRAALKQMQAWQRADAARRASAAMEVLERSGMRLYPVDESQWQAFRERLPDWPELLSDDLPAEQALRLIELASSGAAALAGARAATPSEPSRDPTPSAEQR